MAVWPFRRTRDEEDAARLLAAVTQVSRQPGLFEAGRIADTLEGRFESATLHASLALIRISAAGPERAALAQAFTDQLFRLFDSGLREAGVGDVAVPKRMHKLAGAFQGRFAAYRDALAASDEAVLAEAVARNVLGAARAAYAPALAAYAAQTARAQAEAPVEALFRLDGWRPAPG